MNIYVFGNPDLESDKRAFTVTNKIKPKYPKLNFITVKPNQDLPFVGQYNVIIIDSVHGIKSPKLITDKHLDQLLLSPRTTAHDFDLAFQLKYLKKLDKLNQINIIGIPMTGKINYSSIHSILRKLVAQDMHGS